MRHDALAKDPQGALPSEKQPAWTCVDIPATGPSGSGGAFRSNLNFEENIRSHGAATKPHHNRLQAIFSLAAGGSSSSAEHICDCKERQLQQQQEKQQQDDASAEPQRDWFVDAGSEFLATALLMFVGCAGAFIEMDKPSANVYGGAAFGLGVFMCTTIFGNVSGAHMNPLVSLVNWAFARLRWTRLVVYVVSQMAGALVGLGLLYLMVPQDVQDAVGALTTPPYSACCTRPLDSMSSWSAVLAEFMVTSILLGAACVSIDSPPSHPAFHFGLLVFGICTVEAMYTGASMNPTRTIASAIWTGVWDRFWVFMVGQLGALAFVVAMFARFRKAKQS